MTLDIQSAWGEACYRWSRGGMPEVTTFLRFLATASARYLTSKVATNSKALSKPEYSPIQTGIRRYVEESGLSGEAYKDVMES